MIKWARIVIVGLFVLTLFFSPAKNAIAKPEETVGWQWDASVTAELLPYDKVAPAPYDWVQLLSTGIKVNGPGKLCHEFRKGQFGWVASIYQLTGDKWKKMDSTAGWVPS